MGPPGFEPGTTWARATHPTKLDDGPPACIFDLLTIRSLTWWSREGDIPGLLGFTALKQSSRFRFYAWYLCKSTRASYAGNSSFFHISRVYELKRGRRASKSHRLGKFSRNILKRERNGARGYMHKLTTHLARLLKGTYVVWGS